MFLNDSDTIKICWYWPDTDTDTRSGAVLNGFIRYYVCDDVTVRWVIISINAGQCR